MEHKYNKNLKNDIKCEVKFIWTFTFLYMVYSSYYIGEKVYHDKTKKDNFPFNVGYPIIVLLTNVKSINYTINKINLNKLSDSLKLFSWLFLLVCITIALMYILNNDNLITNYHKYVDKNTLVSSLIYQLSVIYIVYIRLTTKITKHFKYVEDYLVENEGKAVSSNAANLV